MANFKKKFDVSLLTHTFFESSEEFKAKISILMDKKYKNKSRITRDYLKSYLDSLVENWKIELSIFDEQLKDIEDLTEEAIVNIITRIHSKTKMFLLEKWAKEKTPDEFLAAFILWCDHIQYQQLKLQKNIAWDSHLYFKSKLWTILTIETLGVEIVLSSIVEALKTLNWDLEDDHESENQK